jgi:hypothetical protein
MDVTTICCAAEESLHPLQFRGGLNMAQRPTIFTDRKEAELEAYGRLLAVRAAHAVARGAGSVDRVELYDTQGKLVFQASVGELRR